MGGRALVRRLIGAACPQGIFVELKLFAVDSAEDHCADTPVADRQRFGPLGGRLQVSQYQIVGSGGGFALCEGFIARHAGSSDCGGRELQRGAAGET
jgi:hypothetical protein